MSNKRPKRSVPAKRKPKQMEEWAALNKANWPERLDDTGSEVIEPVSIAVAQNGITFDVPLPSSSRSDGYGIDDLPVPDGDLVASKFIPNQEGLGEGQLKRRIMSTLGNAHKKYAAEGRRFTCREVEGGVRIWRKA